ncbi:MAG: hypothetical protein Q9210_003660 [Variospora velana]
MFWIRKITYTTPPPPVTVRPASGTFTSPASSNASTRLKITPLQPRAAGSWENLGKGWRGTTKTGTSAAKMEIWEFVETEGRDGRTVYGEITPGD